MATAEAMPFQSQQIRFALAYPRMNEIVLGNLLISMFAVDRFIEAQRLAQFVHFHRREHIDDS
jgi:hypothetical protein